MEKATALSAASTTHGKRAQNTPHGVADSAEIGKGQLSLDNLDEIRRVTDAKCIARTDSQECFRWDKAALGVAEDERVRSSARELDQFRPCSADQDPFGEYDLFEIDTECVTVCGSLLGVWNFQTT